MCTITLNGVVVSEIALSRFSVVLLAFSMFTPVTLKMSSYSWKCVCLLQELKVPSTATTPPEKLPPEVRKGFRLLTAVPSAPPDTAGLVVDIEIELSLLIVRLVQAGGPTGPVTVQTEGLIPAPAVPVVQEIEYPLEPMTLLLIPVARARIRMAVVLELPLDTVLVVIRLVVPHLMEVIFLLVLVDPEMLNVAVGLEPAVPPTAVPSMNVNGCVL